MLLWIIAAVAAYFVKGLCGFANTLVFTSILGFGAANVDISPVDLLLGLPSNLIMAWKNRKQMDKATVVLYSALMILGSIPGALLLRTVNVQQMKMLFGGLIVVMGLRMILRPRSRSGDRTSPAVTGLVGIFSGLLCGLFGVGAFLAAHMSRTAKSSDAFRGNVSAVFATENVLRLVSYTALGIITFSAVRQALILLPFELAGLYAGMRFSHLLTEVAARRTIGLFLVLSGIMLIVMNMRG